MWITMGHICYSVFSIFIIFLEKNESLVDEDEMFVSFYSFKVTIDLISLYLFRYSKLQERIIIMINAASLSSTCEHCCLN